MKIALIAGLFLICVSPVVMAASGGNRNGGQGEEIRIVQQTQSQVEQQQMKMQQIQAVNLTQLRQMVQQRQQEMIQEMQNMSEVEQKIYQNQNQVRLAVHALLSMENLTGGIGKDVSQIAREFNNSVQATIRAEERLQERSRLVKFFIGSNRGAVQTMEQETNMNQERIRTLTQLMNSCNCTQEVKAVLQEQIQKMEQETNRLQQLAQKEKQNRGIFGWLFRF